MSVRETVIEKIMKCGWDMFAACEEADRIIAEFLQSGKAQATSGVMCGNGRCGDTVTLARAGVGVSKCGTRSTRGKGVNRAG